MDYISSKKYSSSCSWKENEIISQKSHNRQFKLMICFIKVLRTDMNEKTKYSILYSWLYVWMGGIKWSLHIPLLISSLWVHSYQGSSRLAFQKWIMRTSKTAKNQNTCSQLSRLFISSQTSQRRTGSLKWMARRSKRIQRLIMTLQNFSYTLLITTGENHGTKWEPDPISVQILRSLRSRRRKTPDEQSSTDFRPEGSWPSLDQISRTFSHHVFP